MDKQSKYFWSEWVIKITFGWQKGAASFSWHQQSLFVVKTENLKIFFFSLWNNFRIWWLVNSFAIISLSRTKKWKVIFPKFVFTNPSVGFIWYKHKYYVFQHDMTTLRKENGVFQRKVRNLTKSIYFQILSHPRYFSYTSLLIIIWTLNYNFNKHVCFKYFKNNIRLQKLE